MPSDLNSPSGANVGNGTEVRVDGTAALQVTVSWKHMVAILVMIVSAVLTAYVWADGRFDGLSDAISAVADRVSYIEGLLEVPPGRAN